MRLGATLAFMIPVQVSSINCLIAVFWNQVYTIFSFVSAFVSILVIVYYIAFAFEISYSARKTQYTFHSYKHLNFDFPVIYSTFVIKFCEYYMVYLALFVLLIFADYQGFPLTILTTMYVCMFILTQCTPKRDRAEDFKELIKVHFWKRIAMFLKCVFFVLLGFYISKNQEVVVVEVKIYTFLIALLLTLEIVFHFVVLGFRVKGNFRNGISDRYNELSERES